MLATRLERFIQRRLQLAEALYATNETKIGEIKFAVSSLQQEVSGFLNQAQR